MARTSIRNLFGLARRIPARSLSRCSGGLRLEQLETRLVPSTLHVGANEQYHTIQAAVNAAHPYDTIRVDAGTYQEQVHIGPGKDGLKLTGDDQAAIILAPATMTTPRAIVEVSGSLNVTIKDFTIEGPGGGPFNSIDNGIRVDNGGSAIIKDNHITQIEDNPLSGIQNGVAILVGRDNPQGNDVTTGSATIIDNVIDNYQKSGIVIDNVGSSAVIEDNTILGVGPTAVIGQNGIQISRGANADICDNNISGNIYTPQTFAASGILLLNPGQVEVEDNRLSHNDLGIAVQGATGPEISDNRVTDSTFEGILVEETSGAEVSHNRVTDSGVAGIALVLSTETLVRDNKTDDNGSGAAGEGGIVLVGSTNNTIVGNRSNDNNGDGIFVDALSTGNTFSRNHLRDNSNLDAEDQSTGSGTAGTANTWVHNHGETDNKGGELVDSRGGPSCRE